MLSHDVGDLEPAGDFDIVIIGSGYGAAVMAARLSGIRTSGRKPTIAVLERGREYAAEDFPSDGWSTWKETQIWRGDDLTGHRLGMFDVRMDPNVTTLVGCGLGGTSLINAGVSIKPQARVLDQPQWPVSFAELEPYYARAHAMLKPAHTPTVYRKARFLEECAIKAGRPNTWELATINVDFSSCTACGTA